ncbi:MAG: hypothetical protein R3C15_14110 [Thermoleophilia bacterium]
MRRLRRASKRAGLPAAIAGAAGIAGVLAPVGAATVGSSVTAGQLSVTSDGADAIAVACLGGVTQVNGVNVGGDPACATITSIVVSGGPGANLVSLVGANATDFPALTGTTVGGGGGRDTVLGSDRPDVVDLGGDTPNVADGGPGNDSITGGSFADTLTGGAGDDVLAGGGEGRPLRLRHRGGAREDVVVEAAGSGAHDVLDLSALGAGDPALVNLASTDAGLATHAGRTIRTAGPGQAANVEDVLGGQGTDGITGSAQANQLDGGEGADTLTGGGGDDTLTGGAGPDALAGGAGDDEYVFGPTPAAETDTVTELAAEGDGDRLAFVGPEAANVDLAAGGTTVATTASRAVRVGAAGQAANLEHARGGDGNDTLTGNDGANELTGGRGDDQLRGGAGPDVLRGGAGSDALEGGTGDDAYAFSAPDQGAETDVVTEAPGGGRDVLDLSATGAATVNLGSTDATLATQASRTIRVGSAGQAANLEDVVTGAGNDSITGNASDNVLTPGAGSDTVAGGAGDDTYAIAPGAVAETETLVETATGGTDTIALLGSVGGQIDLGSATTALGSLGRTTLVVPGARQAAFLEDVLGSAGDDTITGSAASNRLSGLAGADRLAGGDGDDVLDGGAGGDALAGGRGDDRYLFGRDVPFAETDTISERPGEGTDALDFSRLPATDPLTVSLPGRGALATHRHRTVNAASTRERSLEDVTGGAGNDRIHGTGAVNLIVGGAGRDTIKGEGGDDVLRGGGGNDFVAAGAGDDLVDGGDGDNVATGGAGDDRIRAGAGDDRLDGGAGDDTLDGGAGDDRLTGGTGFDRHLGGDGNDRLFARNRDADHVDGGAGTDQARIDRGQDRVVRVERAG